MNEKEFKTFLEDLYSLFEEKKFTTIQKAEIRNYIFNKKELEIKRGGKWIIEK